MTLSRVRAAICAAKPRTVHAAPAKARLTCDTATPMELRALQRLLRTHLELAGELRAVEEEIDRLMSLGPKEA